MTLRVPDEARDAASLRHFEDPEIVRWLLGGPPQPPERGQGYATRTVRLVAAWVFDDLGLGRLQARTSQGNLASEHVLERVGFRREGLARSGFLLPVSRERVDTTMWSLLQGEVR